MKHSVLDARISSQLAELGRSSPALLPRLQATFAAGTREQLRALEEAIARKDEEEVRRVAHAARGAAASVGALELSGLWAAIEQGASRTQPPAGGTIADLHRQFGLARRALYELAKQCGS